MPFWSVAASTPSSTMRHRGFPQLARGFAAQPAFRFTDIAIAAPSIEDVFVALLEDEGKRQ